MDEPFLIEMDETKRRLERGRREVIGWRVENENIARALEPSREGQKESSRAGCLQKAEEALDEAIRWVKGAMQ